MALSVLCDSFAVAYLKSLNLNMCFGIMSTEGLLMKAAYTCHGLIGPLMPCELSMEQKKTIRRTIKKVQGFISPSLSTSSVTYTKLE